MAKRTISRSTDEMSEWALKQYHDKYAWKDERGRPTETWPQTAERVVGHVLGALGYGKRSVEYKRLAQLVAERKFIPGGRYLAMAGRPFHQVNNCFMYSCEDSREGWADAVRKSVMSLSCGGGIGVVYSSVRPEGARIGKTGGVATGPLSPMQMVNEVARHTMSGGHRRSAIWAGLHWWHDDVLSFVRLKDWDDDVKALKEKTNGLSPAPLDMTNVSVILDTEFFHAYHDVKHPKHSRAREVYWTTVEHALRHGEPGFSVNVGADVDECLRNACTELCSEDDSDVCNLGSINLARIESKAELDEATDLATLFLLAGTVYSDVPHPEVLRTRERNRRLGLGLLGVHEWLLSSGHGYEVTDELRDWLQVWRDRSDLAAVGYAGHHGLSTPVKRRAIAPTGTIGIIAETTTSAEPVLFRACKRRFLDGDAKRFQYVIDPTIERLKIERGLDPDSIETAFSLADDLDRRLSFQADLQEYVDHAISSTVNLPHPIEDASEVKRYGETILKYLPRLRGLTLYPNGARAGQPFEEVSYEEASGNLGVTLDEDRAAQCSGGACGI